uniref:Metastasis associated 1 n=1 Tax=Gouania willdenowi TaxID=441366 RepID=A0A8C5GHZ4_GOUWI
MAANMYRVGDSQWERGGQSGVFLPAQRHIHHTHRSGRQARKGAGGGDGEPRDGRSTRETETPAETQRALSVPSAGVSTSHTHQREVLRDASERDGSPQILPGQRGMCRSQLTQQCFLYSSFRFILALPRHLFFFFFSPPQDAFFYSLVYDPQQKTLLADKGEIRVGNKYQADITDLLTEDEKDGRELEKLEEKVWDPNSMLTEKQIDQFLVVARSVGTFARALDCSSSVRQPSLHMSAAAASRDITLFHAMDTLHATGYDMTRAIAALVPQGGPVLCRDEMEEWSSSEANLFEEALEKYGKDFTDIQQDFLPWKSLTSIIEYYYMWKTTDRYVQQKRLKAAEAESKLKQVYIPNYNKPNPNQLTNNAKPALVNGTAGAAAPGPPGPPGAPGLPCSVLTPGLGRACESCYTSSSYQWYSWGPPNMQCRLCASCWTYWKKYGGLKMPTRLEGERPGPNRSTMSPHGLPLRHSGSPKFAVKTRQAFFLQTTTLTRMARRLCQDIIRPRHLARHPYLPANTAAIKQECALRLPDRPNKPVPLKPVDRKPLESVVRYLEAHPRPAKPNPPLRGGSISSLGTFKSSPILNNGSPTILGKRTYEQHNGLDGTKSKALTPQWDIMAKRMSESGRPSASLQDEIHELD